MSIIIKMFTDYYLQKLIFKFSIIDYLKESIKELRFSKLELPKSNVNFFKAEKLWKIGEREVVLKLGS